MAINVMTGEVINTLAGTQGENLIPGSLTVAGAVDVGSLTINGTPVTSGNVASVSVVSANGFDGTVADPTTTPAITITTSITGVLVGDATAISAAVSGTDLKTVGGNTIIGAGDAGTIGETYGGTAQTEYATGDTLYASGADTLSKLAAGSDTQVLTLAGGVPTWATPAPGGVTSVSGTAARITSTGGATPVIDISASYVGQSSIDTLGTVAVGTWSATAILATKGGTGQTTLLDTGILIGNGTGAVETTSTFIHNTTTGQFLLTPASNTAPSDITISAAGKSDAGSVAGSVSLNAGAGEVGDAAGGNTTVLGGNTSDTGNAGSLFLRGGAANGTAGTGGNVDIQGGTGNSASAAGNALIDAGENYSTGNGGNVRIRGGRSTVAGGYVRIDTATTGNQTERLRILADGAWSVGSSGTETGTAGQVLTSAGSGAVPTWSGPNTASGDVKAFKQTVSLGANTTTDIGTVLPTGATILSVKVNVTVVNTTSTLSVGIGAGPSDYMTVAENDPQTLGLYLAETMVVNSAVQIIATVAAQTGGVGSADVVVTYQIAN